jgi:hypothetical protein
MTWDAQEIANPDGLFRRLHPHHVRKRDNTVGSNAFKRRSEVDPKRTEPDPDISVDLERLTTAEKSLELAGRPEHGIGRLRAGFPRSLAVLHTPDKVRNNCAHSSIRGNEGESAEENCYLLAAEITKDILKLPDKIVG